MKAVIPAAGYGTRFWPATKTVPKEMLPVGAKPALQLIVEEALAAGVDEVIVVTSPGKPSLQAHFAPDPVWRARCTDRPALAAALDHLEALNRRIRWVVQTAQKGLGHALLQAAELLARETEPFLVLLGDALVTGEAPSAEMVAISRAHGGASVVGLEEVSRARVSRYGIVRPAAEENACARVFRIANLVEKPSPEEAPSQLAVAGRYLLEPALFALLAKQAPGAGGEIQLTDALSRLAQERPVYGYRYSGVRHDIGNPAGYLAALQAFAGALACHAE